MNGSCIRRMLIVATLLAGCGSELGAQGLSGTYVGKPGNFIGRLVFPSGNKVELTYPDGGVTVAGTYVIEGKTVKVTLAMGMMQMFQVDAKGCLTSGDDTSASPLCKRSAASARPRVAPTPVANTKANKYVASMKSDLRRLMMAEEAFWRDHSGKYSGTVSCTTPPTPGTVDFCVTDGNNLAGPTVVGDGWSATMTNVNLTNPLVTCAIFFMVAAVAPATTEGAPGCQ